jgi:hypothetical protein
MASVLGYTDQRAYTQHPLHDDERTWPETNCYVDVWILVLNAHGLDPMAGLAFTLATDWEGDQYTFFKYKHNEIRDLYGIEVQELNVWKPLAVHAAEQVALGRLLMPEVDSHFLPDTAGVSYGLDHAKSTIAIDDIDVDRRTLWYFHNRGYHTLSGKDFAGIFRLDEHAPATGVLPPFAEIAKVGRMVRHSSNELVKRSVELTRKHLRNRPGLNPITQHRARIAADLEWLKGQPLEVFHQYAFATVRQAGACFALAASYLRWLEAHGERDLEPAAAEFDTISSTAKTLQFKLARMANLKRDIDANPLLETMERSWDNGMARLLERYGE